MTKHTAIDTRQVRLFELAERRDEISAVQRRVQEQLEWTVGALDINDKAQQRVKDEIDLLKSGIPERDLDDVLRLREQEASAAAGDDGQAQQL